MCEVTPPLIVADGLDVMLYQTVQDLEHDLEAIDVRNDAFKVYDATGRRVFLEARTSKAPWIFGMSAPVDRIKIEGAEYSPLHADELRGVLSRHLEAISASPLVSSNGEEPRLEELVASFARLREEG